MKWMEKTSFAGPNCNRRGSAALKRKNDMQDLNVSNIDQNRVNAILRSIEAELGARAAKRGKKLDALVMGGGRLDPAGVDDLARFACAKNWQILYAAIDEKHADRTLTARSVELSYFCTDGLSRTAVLTGGRLWKRRQHAPARILFASVDTELTAKADGLIYDGPLASHYREEGYDLAWDSIEQRMAADRRSAPVLTSIGATLVVYDMQTMLRLLAGE